LSDLFCTEQVEKSRLEIRTVDGFQGGEKEAIILSLVRSNENKQVGFLSERRRINVAVTRAKRHLVIVCDTDTCSKDAFIDRLLSHVSQRGDHRSALEYMQSIGATLASHTSVVEEFSGDLHSLSLTSATVVQSHTVLQPQNIPDSQRPSAAENKSISKQVRKLEAKKKSEKAAETSPDAFSGHVKNLLLHLALGRLPGGVIGNGALRILSLQNQYLESACAVEEQLAFYSSLITPHKERDAQLLAFPSTLNSHQRLTIHTLAEKINLLENSAERPRAILTHESIGEGEKRRIEVHARLSGEAQASSSLTETCPQDDTPPISSNFFESIAPEELSHSDPPTPADPLILPYSAARPHTPAQKLKKPKKAKEDKVLSGIKAGLTEEELIAAAIRENNVSTRSVSLSLSVPHNSIGVGHLMSNRSTPTITNIASRPRHCQTQRR
jgi:hypothetical protein